MSTTHQDRANFIWSVADLLRGDDKQALLACNTQACRSLPGPVPGLARGSKECL